MIRSSGHCNCALNRNSWRIQIIHIDLGLDVNRTDYSSMCPYMSSVTKAPQLAYSGGYASEVTKATPHPFASTSVLGAQLANPGRLRKSNAFYIVIFQLVKHHFHAETNH